MMNNPNALNYNIKNNKNNNINKNFSYNNVDFYDIKNNNLKEIGKNEVEYPPFINFGIYDEILKPNEEIKYNIIIIPIESENGFSKEIYNFFNLKDKKLTFNLEIGETYFNESYIKNNDNNFFIPVFVKGPNYRDKDIDLKYWQQLEKCFDSLNSTINNTINNTIIKRVYRRGKPEISVRMLMISYGIYAPKNLDYNRYFNFLNYQLIKIHPKCILQVDTLDEKKKFTKFIQIRFHIGRALLTLLNSKYDKHHNDKFIINSEYDKLYEDYLNNEQNFINNLNNIIKNSTNNNKKKLNLKKTLNIYKKYLFINFNSNNASNNVANNSKNNAIQTESTNIIINNKNPQKSINTSGNTEKFGSIGSNSNINLNNRDFIVTFYDTLNRYLKTSNDRLNFITKNYIKYNEFMENKINGTQQDCEEYGNWIFNNLFNEFNIYYNKSNHSNSNKNNTFYNIINQKFSKQISNNIIFTKKNNKIDNLFKKISYDQLIEHLKYENLLECISYLPKKNKSTTLIQTSLEKEDIKEEYFLNPIQYILGQLIIEQDITKINMINSKNNIIRENNKYNPSYIFQLPITNDNENVQHQINNYSEIEKLDNYCQLELFYEILRKDNNKNNSLTKNKDKLRDFIGGNLNNIEDIINDYKTYKNSKNSNKEKNKEYRNKETEKLKLLHKRFNDYVNSETKKINKIIPIGNNIIIQLKIFKFNEGVSNKIKYKDHDDTIKINNEEYNLESLICHQGDSIAGGHYVTFLRNKSGGWYFADDQKNEIISKNDIDTNIYTPYLLYYKKIIQKNKINNLSKYIDDPINIFKNKNNIKNLLPNNIGDNFLPISIFINDKCNNIENYNPVNLTLKKNNCFADSFIQLLFSIDDFRCLMLNYKDYFKFMKEIITGQKPNNINNNTKSTGNSSLGTSTGNGSPPISTNSLKSTKSTKSTGNGASGNGSSGNGSSGTSSGTSSGNGSSRTSNQQQQQEKKIKNITQLKDSFLQILKNNSVILEKKQKKINDVFDNILKEYNKQSGGSKKLKGGNDKTLIDDICNGINDINVLEDVVNNQYEFFNNILKDTSKEINNEKLNEKYYNQIGNNMIFNDIKFAKIMTGNLFNEDYPNNTTKKAYKKIIF